MKKLVLFLSVLVFPHAVGKRKTAVARVWLKPGQGLITVNRKPLLCKRNKCTAFGFNACRC
ncbi:MAG: 30S ribosomal protein S9 [Desulfotignum sp.]